MFLRAEGFHPKKAADRMIRFLREKLALFGPDLLCKERIVLDDLDEETKRFMESGSLQIIGKDRSERNIVFGAPQFRPAGASILTAARFQFYLLMSAVQDDEISQKKGLAGIFYLVDQTPWILTGRQEEGRQLQVGRDAVPMRFSGLHCCFNDPTIRPVLGFWLLLVGTFSRRRLCLHYGQHIKCKYDLMTYGISPDIVPLDSSGVLQLESHRQWIEHRRNIEASTSGGGVGARATMSEKDTRDMATPRDFQPPHERGLQPASMASASTNDDEPLLFHPVETFDLAELLNMEDIADPSFDDMALPENIL